MVGSVRLLNADVTATQRYFGEWTTSECGGDSMTIYISQGRYTSAAIKGMSAKPEDRSEAVAELFAAAGGRLISWYLTLGPYDWLIIAEAPDEPTMISAVLAAAAGGSLSDITTTVALTASDTTKAFQRAGELTLKFRSAGRADYYGVGIDWGVRSATLEYQILGCALPPT